MRQQDMLAQKALVLEYFRMWNTGDTSRAAALLSPNFRYTSNANIDDVDSLVGAVRAARSTDPLLHVFIDALLGGQSMITVVGRIVQSGQNGRQVTDSAWTFRVDDQIAEIWAHRDLDQSAAAEG